MNVFEVLFGGAGLAVLSGLAFIAYKHPAGYRHLMDGVLKYIFVGGGLLLVAYTGFLLAGIYSLGAEVEQTGDLPLTISLPLQRYASGARFVMYGLFGGGLLLLYLVFLRVLPAIIGTEKGEEAESSHDGDESLQLRDKRKAV
jgi:hypothetical protein